MRGAVAKKPKIENEKITVNYSYILNNEDRQVLQVHLPELLCSTHVGWGDVMGFYGFTACLLLFFCIIYGTSLGLSSALNEKQL